MSEKAPDVSCSPARTTARALTLIVDVLITCEIAEGTPLIIRSASGLRSSPASASRLGTISMLPPAVSGVKISNTDTSKLSEVDARTVARSAAVNSARAQASITKAGDGGDGGGVVEDDLGRPVRQVPPGQRGGEDGDGAGIGEHIGDPVRRVGRVHRDVRGAGL